MRYSFTGEFAKLDQFADRISKTPAALKVVSEQLAEETIELIRECFETHTDPYGHAWEEHSDLTKKLRPGGQILEDNGGLKASWSRRETGLRGFRVANHKEYAAYHQHGTGIYGPRKQFIVPTSARALRVPMPGGGAVFMKRSAGSPQRAMVPDSRGLPAKWGERYVEVAHEVLEEFFR